MTVPKVSMVRGPLTAEIADIRAGPAVPRRPAALCVYAPSSARIRTGTSHGL
jgi:hypothetical protein